MKWQTTEKAILPTPLLPATARSQKSNMIKQKSEKEKEEKQTMRKYF